MSRIITIGREFGSGGREIGKRLSDELGIAYYDNEIISQIAEKSDCVIVGRSADYILREKHPFRLFVYAEMEHKMERCKKRAPESEHFTDKELKRHILDVDKRRARYYQFFTGQTWGDRLNYDLCINTSNYDIKELVHAIAHLVEA